MDPEFVKWRNDSASSILWLHGIPGSGKSKLVSIVIEDAFRSFHHGFGPQPAYFYCSRNTAEPTRSDPEKILASIARQLSGFQTGQALLSPVTDLYERKEAEGFASGPLRADESCALISQLVERYPMVMIIVDALDECDLRKRRELLKALERILRDSSSLVKIFVSSRYDQDMVFRLQHYPNLEVQSDRNGRDIAAFVESQTQLLVSGGELLRYSDEQEKMESLIVSKVIAGAGGMYVWK